MGKITTTKKVGEKTLDLLKRKYKDYIDPDFSDDEFIKLLKESPETVRQNLSKEPPIKKPSAKNKKQEQAESLPVEKPLDSLKREYEDYIDPDFSDDEFIKVLKESPGTVRQNLSKEPLIKKPSAGDKKQEQAESLPVEKPLDLPKRRYEKYTDPDFGDDEFIKALKESPETVRQNLSKEPLIKKPSVRDKLAKAGTVAAGTAALVGTAETTGKDTDKQEQVEVHSVQKRDEPTKIPTPEQVKKRQKDKQTVAGGIGKIEKPREIDKFIGELGKLNRSLSPADRKIFTKRLEKLKGAKERAIRAYEKDKNETKWLEVAETLGQALVQLGAGMYGMKHNVDMSGLKFNKADWSKNIDIAAKELDRKLGLIGEEEEGVQKELSEAEARVKRNADLQTKILMRDFFDQQKFYQDRLLQGQRLAAQARMARQTKASPAQKKAAKQAEAQLKDMIKQQEGKVKKLEQAEVEQAKINEGMREGKEANVLKYLGADEYADVQDKSKTTLFGFWDSIDDDKKLNAIASKVEQAKQILNQYKQQLFGGTKPEPTGPQPGDVLDGYRFKGGDPTDQNNWEEAK